ncbi:MAG TPA: hypothetical protein VFN48_05060 [Solirubrobacteraceae bacterium]|nr:hypothetical protein [Solirubrobacteraceae bacterium]
MRSRAGLLTAVIAVVLLVVGVAQAITLLRHRHHGPPVGPAPVRVQLDAGARAATVTVPLGGAGDLGATARVPVDAQSPAQVDSALAAAGENGAEVTLADAAGTPVMPAGFVGLSLEYQAVPTYAAEGSLFASLVANLTPGSAPVLRVGGDSGDHAWIPGSAPASPGLWYPLDTRWFSALGAIASATGGQFVMGLDLEANQPQIPVREYQAFRRALGSSLVAVEPGNEPELYTVFPWYANAAHRPVFVRSSRSWGPSAYVRELRGILPALGTTPLWGPGLTDTSQWWNSIPTIAAGMPHLSTITDHAYATNCYVAHTAAHWPTVGNLIAASASAGLVDEVNAPLQYALRTHRSFRIDETNTVSCAGTQTLPGFASAVWPIEAGFAFAAAGISGVNIESNPTALTRLFTFGAAPKTAVQGGPGLLPHAASAAPVSVSDEYYGWMLFARAAPAGWRLLSADTAGDPNVHAFATRHGSATNVVLVNDSATAPATVSLHGTGGSLAVVEPLRGAGLAQDGSMSLDGMAISPHTGRLSGQPRVSVLSGEGDYSVTLPPASADLVTVTH